MQMYIENGKVFHVVIYNWKYIHILNSSTYFSPEIGEMKTINIL